MLKIVLTNERTILHALLVYDIATERELPDNIGTPLAELCGTDGIDSIAHGDDGIECLSQPTFLFLFFSEYYAEQNADGVKSFGNNKVQMPLSLQTWALALSRNNEFPI